MPTVSIPEGVRKDVKTGHFIKDRCIAKGNMGSHAGTTVAPVDSFSVGPGTVRFFGEIECDDSVDFIDEDITCRLVFVDLEDRSKG